MAPYAFSVTKKMLWHGADEEFSNVWHYDNSVTDLATLEAVLDAIVVQEKALYPAGVTFVKGRVWGPTSAGPSGSETRVIKDLSGNGTYSPSTPLGLYGECAVVAQFYLGRKPGTGRKRFLRKFLHVRQLNSSDSGVAMGQAVIPATEVTRIKNWMNGMKNLSVAGANQEICAPNGDHLPLATDCVVLPYVHMRQFKQ